MSQQRAKVLITADEFAALLQLEPGQRVTAIALQKRKFDPDPDQEIIDAVEVFIADDGSAGRRLPFSRPWDQSARFTIQEFKQLAQRMKEMALPQLLRDKGF